MISILEKHERLSSKGVVCNRQRSVFFDTLEYSPSIALFFHGTLCSSILIRGTRVSRNSILLPLKAPSQTHAAALFHEFPLTRTKEMVSLQQALSGTEVAPHSTSHRLTGHLSGNVPRAAQGYGLGCSQCFPTEKRKMIFIAYADLNHATLPVLIALGYLEVRHTT